MFFEGPRNFIDRKLFKKKSDNMKGSKNVYFNYCRMHSQILLFKTESGTVKCDQILLHTSTFRD